MHLSFASIICAKSLRDRSMRFLSKKLIAPLLTIQSPVAQWLECPARSRRVVCSNPHLELEFFSELMSFHLIFFVLSNTNYGCYLVRIFDPFKVPFDYLKRYKRDSIIFPQISQFVIFSLRWTFEPYK